MDYDDNDSKSQNLHLAGEGNNKFPPVLRPYALPRFDFDDNLHGHLRFDSLVETEVFLDIEGSEDNHWIEDFSRGSTGIAFSSCAAESCLISRRNNVWSEAASSESVEMLLKSVGQDETITGQTISKNLDACDELGCIINQMEPSLKHRDSGLSKVGDDLQPALQICESPGKFSGLEGDHQLVEDVSQTHEFNASVDGALKDLNSSNTDLLVTERDESKNAERIIVNKNVEASDDQSVDNRDQEDKFASGSQVDTVIPCVASSALVDSQDTTHLKNDIIDENVDSLAGENVDLSQEIHIDGENLIENAVASITSLGQKRSAVDIQSKEDGHAIGNIRPSVGEPFDRILKGNSDLHMVEGCSEGLSVESPLQTGKSKDIALSEGKLHDISPTLMPFVGDTTLKEHGSDSNTDTQISASLEPKLDSAVEIACDAVGKKDLLESDCHPDKKILSSKSEKSLLLVDGKGSKGEGEGAQNTSGAEPMKVYEEYIVTEQNDDYKSDQSVSAAVNQSTKLSSDGGNIDCEDDGSVLVMKGVDSSSLGTGGTANELASNLQSNVAVSGKSVDCILLPSSRGLSAAVGFEQKKGQVSFSEASFSIMKTSGLITKSGAPCETGRQSSCKKVAQSLLEDPSNDEGRSGDLTLHGVTKDVHASSIVSDSTVRGTDGAQAQVISKRGSSEGAGAVSIQENNKTSTNSVPSTSKGPYHDAVQNHPEYSDPNLVSEEKISGHFAEHHVDRDHAKTHNLSITSAPSSEFQTKILVMVSGSSSADLDNPSCGSPIVIKTGQSQSKIEKDDVKGSKGQIASVSGVMNGETNTEQSISQDTKGNDASTGDRTFTFEVPSLADLSEKDAGKNWQPFSAVQHGTISSFVEGTPSTSRLSEVGAKAAQEVSHANLQASERENTHGGSKGTSVRRTRRVSSKSTGKEAAKKGTAAKEMTPARQSERSDRTSSASLSLAGIGQLVQSNEMQHCGHMEVFHQPFTDLQQIQLRAQIFVYGALIQGTAPDEAYMISAFGGTDGGRTIWENTWRACMDRLHSQKSQLVNPETPLPTHMGAKTPDQSIKQHTLQNKVTSSPASRSTCEGTPTTIINPMIPLSLPLWNIPTPSGDALQPTGIPRGAVMDYQQAFSPMHPPPIRNFVGPNAPWISQPPFRGPWVPQTSAFDCNAHFPVLPTTETVNLTPVREASVPYSSAMKQVSTVPMVQSGSPAVFAGTPLLDTKKATVTPGQRSADPKPRKRKKSTVSEDPGQIILSSKTESASATVVTGHACASAAITAPASIISKSSSDKFITVVSADHLKKGDQHSDQRATLSEETSGKLKEAQKQAEDAAALAAAAVSHGQEIWNQLDKHKNSGLAPDLETELTSASVTITAAAAVAKAAAAAANVAANAALLAKLMADEALVSSDCRSAIPTNAIAFDSVKKLGKATPASILRGQDAATGSNSVIIAAREAARRRVEAASAASKRAENMDAIVKAAELAAEAVSQAGKIVAMGEPFPLTELVEAGPESYWKLSQAPSEPNGDITEHLDKGGSVEAPGSSTRHPKEGEVDEREKQSDDHGKSPTLMEMARESMDNHSRLTDGILGAAAASGKDKKEQKGRKASDIAKTKGVTSESEIGSGPASMSTQTEPGKAGETSKDKNIREGSRVEVLRDGDGLKAAWFLADILDLKDGKAYVRYNELRSEDGDKLKEWVELEGEGDTAPRIRTARPILAMPFEGTRKRCRAALGDYNWSVGDRVDSWMQDSWWEGVVTEKSKKDEQSFTVHFPAQGETSVVKAWLLRPSLMWKNNTWVEWSSSRDNNGSSKEVGDTPQEKRPRMGSPMVEAEEQDKLSKSLDIKESWKPDDMRLLDLSVSGKIFNIGKSTRDESKPDSLRMIRTGLKKEGSRVIFGVPKPGKKRKFMEVSKHYVADQGSKTHETSDSAKFTKYLMPKVSDSQGTKNKIEPKETRMAVSKPRVLKSGKPPGVSSRTIPKKESLSNTVVSEPDDAAATDPVSNAENISGKHNMMEFRSFSSSDGAAKGPVFSTGALASDAPHKRTSTSNAKSERISKAKLAPAAGKLAKIEEEKVFNGNSMKTVSEVVEPRRSNRRIQPTSRLLEGLQSSLIISKIPSVSHDKNHKSQSRSTRGNNQG